MLTKKRKNKWLCIVMAAVFAVTAAGCSFMGIKEAAESAEGDITEKEPDQTVSITESEEKIKLSTGPFVGYVADAKTSWIDLYTEKNGTFAAQIPYEIFRDWPATDRSSDNWKAGWMPDCIHFYYAEFGDFRWAGAHRTDTVPGNGRKNIATSSDGGKTWTCVSAGNDYRGNHVTGIGFASESTAFMSFDSFYEFEDYGTDGPAISRTTDGGKTWERLDITVPEEYGNYRMTPFLTVFDGNYGKYEIGLYEENKRVGTAYLYTHDGGLTWDWEPETAENRTTEYTVTVPLDKENRETLVYAASYGTAGGFTYSNQICTGEDGVRYEVFGIGSDYKNSGIFSTYHTYRVTSKNGYLESVEETETFTKEIVLANGTPYDGPPAGLYTCKSYRKGYGLIVRTVYLQENGKIDISAFLDGTDAGGTYSGSYAYDPSTGDFSASLVFRIASEEEITLSEQKTVRGKLLSLGGYVHFVCESSGFSDLAPDDPLPLTFVPNTDGMMDAAQFTLTEDFAFAGFCDIPEEQGERFFYLEINPQTSQIRFYHGNYESEYINRYEGTFSVNPVTNLIQAVLYDKKPVSEGNPEEDNPAVNLTFRLGYSIDKNGKIFLFSVEECDEERYRTLIGTTLMFDSEPKYPVKIAAQG